MPTAISSDELIASAQTLAPLIAEHAPEAERQRRPADEVIDALSDARIFELMVPEAHGGLELDIDTFLEVGLTLAAVDASISWLTSFFIVHNWMLCQFPIEFQNELYEATSCVLAPAPLKPSGMAEPTKGGYLLSGRWQWATGVTHSPDWILCGALRPNPAGPPELMLVAVPRSEVTVEDVWFTDGMCATGSNDIIIDGAFIPFERTLTVAPLAEGIGSPVHDTPLYRTPFLLCIILGVGAPAVGQARAAVRQFHERIQSRVMFGGTLQRDKASAHMTLAKADLEAGQAEQLLRSVATEAMDLRNSATVEDRARLTATVALAVDQSKQVIRTISAASGASAHFLDDPLQRALRDVEILSSHFVLNLEARTELLGRTMLGLDPGGLV
ncbi:MAG: acyl-CoA dehydrogenase [Actinobacteria bacterium]|nr:acyl-CoA dehydrogenase [Actinomycetota bacterium]